ncbi:MAG: hotdog fold thioesterase [Salibacteraceae bacterium]
MAIWHNTPNIEQAQGMKQGTLLETLGIEITELGDDYLRGTMPVDSRTMQPYGILHGGASVSLAETLGSIAAHLVVDNSVYATVGMEINANHLRPVTKGLVTGTAKPIHLGRSSHVWSIEIVDANKNLICISRLTMAVIKLSKLK